LTRMVDLPSVYDVVGVAVAGKRRGAGGAIRPFSDGSAR
jgi:hypothetical protein